MPIGCVLIPHFPYSAETARWPELKSAPFFVIKSGKSGKVIVDFSPYLSRLTPGMPLEHGLALVKNARIIEADEAHYRTILKDILKAVQQRFPTVEPEELGCVYIDLTGFVELYGGEAGVALTLQRSLPKHLPAKIGIGPNKFVAYLAAQKADLGSAFKAPLDARSFVKAFYVNNLPVKFSIILRLRQLGFKALKDIASVGIGPLQAQFGPEGKLVWELAHGIDDRPLIPRKHEDSVTESMTLPYTSVTIDMLLLGIEALLKKIFSMPGIKGKYAGKATVECRSADSPIWQRTYAFKERLSSPDKALFAVKSRLKTDPPLMSIEEVSLTLSDFAGGSGTQGSLLRDIKNLNDGRAAEVAQRLQARMNGMPSLYRVATLDPEHPLPELRSVLVPVNSAEADNIRPMNVPLQVTVKEQNNELTILHPQKRNAEKAMVKESWHVDLWWMPQPVNRTYYRAITHNGHSVTLFRDNRSGNWYVQGA